MGIMIRTTGLEDYLPGDENGQGYVKALILGEPGVGKTRSSGFWPKPLLVDCEKGRMSVADLRIPYVEIVRTDEMFAVLDEVKRECAKPAHARRFQTLIIDTLDAYQRIVMQDRLAAERKDTFDGWRDWGYLDAKMLQVVHRMVNLPINLVVNVHVKSSNNDDGPAVFGPKLKGDFKDQIAAEFDLVGHMTTQWVAEGGERVLKRGIRWHADPTFPMLKDRSGRLPRFTPVTFSSEDYTNLFLPMVEALDDLKKSETIGEIEMEEPVAPAPPDIKGGPVPIKEDAPKAKPAPKKAKKEPEPPAITANGIEVVEAGASAAPVDEPAESGEMAATGETTPVKGAVGLDMAIQAVKSHLGGEVISDEVPADSSSAPPAPHRRERTCGTAGRLRDGTENPHPAPGCGKSLDGENKDLVNVAFLKTRTYLCPDCLKSYKAAS